MEQVVPKPEIDPSDVADIKHLVEEYLDTHPRNVDGSFHGRPLLTPEQADGIVNTVLRELGSRGYAIMKPRTA